MAVGEATSCVDLKPRRSREVSTPARLMDGKSKKRRGLVVRDGQVEVSVFTRTLWK
jgi:hypothetical protein